MQNRVAHLAEHEADIEARLRDDRSATVNRLARPIQDAAEQLGRDVDLRDLFEEADLSLCDVDALRALEDLDDGHVAGYLEHLPGTTGVVGHQDGHHLVVRDAFDVLHEDQRARDVAQRAVVRGKQ